MSTTSDLPEESLQTRRLASLRDTWIYAREHSPYYARTLPALRPEDVSIQALQAVPICTRDDVARLRNDLRCKRGLPSYMVFTGGSTSLPLLICGSEDDLRSRARARIPGAVRPLVLSTDSGHHGTVPMVPGSADCIQVPLRNRKNYEWAWHLLTTEHSFEGYESKVSFALLPLPAVKKLAYFVLENGLDTSMLALSAVGTLAWHLSRRWRRLLETVFNTRVIDHYGFTETPGAVARECGTCGFYHYGPEIVWEVLEAHSDRPIEEGIGKLVVTSLLPRVHDLVLFRYAPGDLVEQGPACEHFGERGFRPVGRLNQSFSVAGPNHTRTWALLPSQVQEQVDLHHWIARMNDARFAGITASEDDGFPKWRIRAAANDSVPVFQIDLEMKSDPRLFYDDWQSFERVLRTQLMQANPTLDQLVREGRARLRIAGLPPGGLADKDVFIC